MAAVTEFFFQLTPDRVLDAVERAGFLCTGYVQTLNSFENRVYEVEVEDRDTGSRRRYVTKFYRPGRWSPEQIREEHEFIRDLNRAEIPAIAPIAFPGGGEDDTLRIDSATGIAYAIFPKVGGRAPDELTPAQLRQIGRLLARIHSVGQAKPAPHRVRLSPATYGTQNLEFLLKKNLIPIEFRARYEAAARRIVSLSEPLFADKKTLRLHGDCHLGNLLFNRDEAFFLDFDDMVVGPAVQDLWLLIPGRESEHFQQFESLLDGYEEMRDFDRREMRLVEPLRALRFIHYTAWVARRWEDPAFPIAFPEFGSHRYWADETLDLERQLELIESRPEGGI